MRDIQVRIRGSGATREEQTDSTIRARSSECTTSSDPYVALEHLVRGETPSRPGSVLVLMTYKFLRWMHSTRRVDEEVVTSEKCWSGIEKKMPEISREVNWMNWLRIGHVSTLPGGHFFKQNNLKIRMDGRLGKVGKPGK